MGKKRYPHSDTWTVLGKKHNRFDFVLFIKLIRFVLKNKPDVVHAHCEASALYLGMVCKLLLVPSVGTIHRSKLHSYNSGWKNRMYYGFLTAYIAVSNERKGRMHDQLALPINKIEVIHWGVDLEVMPEQMDRATVRHKLDLDDRPIILSLGHLGPIKGHDDSIQAISLVKKKIPGIKLYIGGDGEIADYERLHTLIENLKLQDSAILLGQVINSLEWMEACDIFLQPSLEEAFGLVFIEAGLCRRPCIATNVGGIPEIIVDGQSGFLVNPHDHEAIASRILDLLESVGKRQTMGEAAFNHVQQNFLLSKQVDKLESYLRIVAKCS